MASTLQRRTRLTFAWVALIPILLGITLFAASKRYQTSVAWVAHTQEVLTASETLLFDVSDAVSNQRGYLLSHDPNVRERFNRARDRIGKQVGVLRNLTIDNLRQQSALARLQVAVDRRIVQLDEFVAQADANPSPQSLSSETIQQETGRTFGIREICNQVIAEETRLLAVRKQQQRNVATTVLLLLLSAVVITALLLLGASKVISVYADERDQSELQLKQLNIELEARVAERTAELTALNEKLSRSNQDLTQFAYIASHDLQEPLRTVASYAGLLARRYQGQLDEQADRYIQFVVSGAKRMQALVQDLLTYSRAGTQALQLEPIELEGVLKEVRDSLRLTIHEKGAQLSYSQLPALRGDSRKLSLVFQNLITNALKFMSPGKEPRIHIGALREGSHWLLCVADNGIGFETAYAERIFGIFQRLHSVGAYPGTGMGLAICKRIVEAHGGRIWAESVVDAGSKFYFTLPA